MATMHTKEQEAKTLAALEAARCTAVVRHSCGETARGATDAVIRGGFRSVEFTLSIPNALELIAHYSKQPDLVVGAGTVLSIEEAEATVRAGAHFIVMPCLELSVVKWCAARNVVCMAGVSTPSEMWAAHKAGAHVAKIFPGAAVCKVLALTAPALISACEIFPGAVVYKVLAPTAPVIMIIFQLKK